MNNGLVSTTNVNSGSLSEDKNLSKSSSCAKNGISQSPFTYSISTKSAFAGLIKKQNTAIRIKYFKTVFILSPIV